MTCSDWISIICASISLIVTIVIAVLQLWQSGRMEKFERRQDERDERRHAEEVKSQAVSFISKHYSDRDLIPLCAMAAMHNDLYYYSREMYREFCCMTLETQNRVLEYCGLDLRVTEEKGLFERCINAVEEVLCTHFPDDKAPFYDWSKYVSYGLESYGSEKIPIERINYCSPYTTGLFAANFDGTSSYESCITDILSESFRGNDSEHPIFDLELKYGFDTMSEKEACQFAMVLARFVAIYGSENNNPDKNYGAPDDYVGEPMNMMEDLFLLTIFEIYTCLILK